MMKTAALRLSLLALALQPVLADAQTSYPSLVCRRILPDEVCNGGRVPEQGQPTLLPLTAYGQATWNNSTYPPLPAGLANVNYGYSLPDLQSMVMANTSCNGAPVHMAVRLVRADLYGSLTWSTAINSTTFPNRLVSSSIYNYGSSIPLAVNYSAGVEAPITANETWSIVIQEGNFASSKGPVWSTQKTLWTKNAAVCKLPVTRTGYLLQ